MALSSYCNSQGQQSCDSCHGGDSRVLSVPPICDCGELVFVQTIRTAKNNNHCKELGHTTTMFSYNNLL